MHDQGSNSRRVRFGVFELDVRSGELRKGPTRLKVPHKSIEILRALLEQPGELVTREALRDRLWPGNTFVDFEHGLNAAVRRLRDALGDSAETPRFIETLPRRGYRFVGTVADSLPAANPDARVTSASSAAALAGTPEPAEGGGASAAPPPFRTRSAAGAPRPARAVGLARRGRPRGRLLVVVSTSPGASFTWAGRRTRSNTTK